MQNTSLNYSSRLPPLPSGCDPKATYLASDFLQTITTRAFTVRAVSYPQFLTGGTPSFIVSTLPHSIHSNNRTLFKFVNLKNLHYAGSLFLPSSLNLNPN